MVAHTFFIAKTIHGTYYVGLDYVTYNTVKFTERNYLMINNRYIPTCNVDFVLKKLELPEYKSLCEKYRITEQDDYRESLRQYYEVNVEDQKIRDLILYFSDLMQ